MTFLLLIYFPDFIDECAIGFTAALLFALDFELVFTQIDGFEGSVAVLKGGFGEWVACWITSHSNNTYFQYECVVNLSIKIIKVRNTFYHNKRCYFNFLIFKED